MSGEHTFQCPNCGAQLAYHRGDGPTVICAYCDTSIIVPEELYQEGRLSGALPHLESTVIEAGTRTVRQAGRISCVIVVLAVLLLAGVGLAVFLLLNTASREVVPEVLPHTDSVEVSRPAFAEVDFTFGSEGVGPGRFSDARHIAVDGEGHIYVGEYSDGRIQVFNPSGEFLAQWMVDSETPLRSLAVDRTGTVYVVQGGVIYRHEGMTGDPLGALEYAEGRGFDDVAVTLDGGLVAAWQMFQDTLIRFDANGRVMWTVPEAVSGQTEEGELSMRVAVDGLGNVYVLGHFNEAVLKFSPEGRFLNRFGGSGDEPGQFRAVDAIAVDGRGWVYVSDIKGIQVFDPDGRYLDRIEVDGVAFGLAFDDQDHLWVVARDHVSKYVLNE